MRQIKEDTSKDFRTCVREIDGEAFTAVQNACPDFFMHSYQSRVVFVDLNDTKDLALTSVEWRLIHTLQDEGYDFLIGVVSE